MCFMHIPAELLSLFFPLHYIILYYITLYCKVLSLLKYCGFRFAYWLLFVVLFLSVSTLALMSFGGEINRQPALLSFL